MELDVKTLGEKLGFDIQGLSESVVSSMEKYYDLRKGKYHKEKALALSFIDAIKEHRRDVYFSNVNFMGICVFSCLLFAAGCLVLDLCPIISLVTIGFALIAIPYSALSFDTAALSYLHSLQEDIEKNVGYKSISTLKNALKDWHSSSSEVTSVCQVDIQRKDVEGDIQVSAEWKNNKQAAEEMFQSIDVEKGWEYVFKNVKDYDRYTSILASYYSSEKEFTIPLETIIVNKRTQNRVISGLKSLHYDLSEEKVSNNKRLCELASILSVVPENRAQYLFNRSSSL